MAGITLAQAQTRLDDYMAAELAVLGGQQYEIAGRMLRRADLRSIREGIQYWSAQVSELTTKAARRSRAIVPRPNSSF